MKNHTINKLFILIFILAAILRLTGSFTYTEKMTPAEGNILSNSAFMWQRNTLEQKEFAYPSLYYFVSLTAQKISYYSLFLLGIYPPVEEFIYSVHFWNNVYFTGRILSIIFTLIIFIFLFKLAKSEFDDFTGIIATLFLAFSYIDVINSRLAKPDSLTNLMVFMSVYMSIKYFREKKAKFLYIASLFVGLSVSSKYFFISAVPLVLAIFYNEDKIKTKFKNLVIAGATSIFIFFLTCPFCILDYKEVIKTFTGAQNFVGGYIVPIHNTYLIVFKDLLYYTGYGIFILFIAGIVMALRKNWKIHTIILSFSAVYLFMLCISEVYGARYLVYLLPYVSLYAAYFLAKIIRKRAFVLLLAMLLVTPSAIPSTRAAFWLSQGSTNIKIMNNFINNSIPDLKLIVSYHAYKLDGRRYINYPKFVLNFKKPMFFIYGFYEDYFCWENSKYMQWCEELKKKLINYHSVLKLEKHNIPEYVFDYPLTLLKKNFPPSTPPLLYPALVKLMGNSEFMFPGNHYVKDTTIVFLKPFSFFSKKYYSNGTGKVCLLVERISSGRYSVIMSTRKWKNLTERTFFRCITPEQGVGKISVKPGNVYLNIYLTTSPINLAQILATKEPEKAIYFLKELSYDRFYSFEARRMLVKLLFKTGKLKAAMQNWHIISPKADILSRIKEETFKKTYKKDGFDEIYLKLSQRIYPEFSRRSRESDKFFLFPGVYRLNKTISGFLKNGGKIKTPLSDRLIVENPGWYSIVVTQDTIPLDFYLYFDPENTLKFELQELKNLMKRAK